MDVTKTDAGIATADAKAGAASPTEAGRPGARERARAYLDLWERNLVQLALHGPCTPGDPPPRPDPKAG